MLVISKVILSMPMMFSIISKLPLIKPEKLFFLSLDTSENDIEDEAWKYLKWVTFNKDNLVSVNLSIKYATSLNFLHSVFNIIKDQYTIKRMLMSNVI